MGVESPVPGAAFLTRWVVAPAWPEEKSIVLVKVLRCYFPSIDGAPQRV